MQTTPCARKRDSRHNGGSSPCLCTCPPCCAWRPQPLSFCSQGIRTRREGKVRTHDGAPTCREKHPETPTLERGTSIRNTLASPRPCVIGQRSSELKITRPLGCYLLRERVNVHASVGVAFLTTTSTTFSRNSLRKKSTVLRCCQEDPVPKLFEVVQRNSHCCTRAHQDLYRIEKGHSCIDCHQNKQAQS